jgi:hypothetical protein
MAYRTNLNKVFVRKTTSKLRLLCFYFSHNAYRLSVRKIRILLEDIAKVYDTKNGTWCVHNSTDKKQNLYCVEIQDLDYKKANDIAKLFYVSREKDSFVEFVLTHDTHKKTTHRTFQVNLKTLCGITAKGAICRKTICKKKTREKHKSHCS